MRCQSLKMNQIKLLSWNVDGLRARYRNGQLSKILNDDYDIICIQETKTPLSNIPHDLNPPKGFPFCSYSQVQKGSFAGVAIFSKKKWNTIYEGFGGTDFDHEGRILVVEFDEFTLLNVYFPLGAEPADSLQHKLAFYDAFLCYVNQLLDKGRRVIVCGDFNIAYDSKDLVNPFTTPPMIGILPEERKKLDALVELGFIDAFRHIKPDLVQYTRWSYQKNARLENLGWRLDYFFVSKELQDSVISSDILYHPLKRDVQPQIEGSDHCPISLEMNLK